MFVRFLAILITGAFSVGIANAASVQTTRYLGTPNLPLTAALVAAGGGAKHFDSLRLLAILTGPQYSAEVRRLTQRFGKARVAAFAVTFDRAIEDSLAAAKRLHVTLPPAGAISHNGAKLSARLVAAGVMPNGRFDVGYMIEHLVSRNIHVIIMRELDSDPDVGAQRNAEFHIILTAVVGDLRTEYGV